MEVKLTAVEKTVNGQSLHLVTVANADYVEKNRADSIPKIIFIHGAGSNHLNWKYQWEELAQKHGMMVLAVDLPGHGKSEWFDPVPSPSVEHYADVLLQLLTRLHLENAWLVGHSMGGAVVQQLMLRVSSEASMVARAIKGLVIIGSGSHLPVSPSLLQMLEQSPSLALEKLIKWGIYKGLAEENPSRYQELQSFVRKLFAQSRSDVVLFDFQACARFDVRTRLHSIQHPVGIIVGQNDVMTPPPLSEELRDELPHVLEVKKIPRAGHLVMLERPSEVTSTIVKWVNDVSSQQEL